MQNPVRLFALPFAALLATSLPAQGDWQFRSSPSVPAKKLSAMAYDSARQVSVLQDDRDTWEWNGSSWLLRSLISTPGSTQQLYGYALSYDAVRQRMIMFGGQSSTSSHNLVYEWDGTQVGWIQITPVTSPPRGRMDHAMVYESTQQRHLVFGGLDLDLNPNAPDIPLSDTWSWDGTFWINLDPVTSPSPRSGHEMSHNLGNGEVLLFGGKAGEEIYPDTWSWDGSNWTERFPATVPPARHGHSMAYDAARGRVFMFGGQDEDGRALNDCWEWDGDNWIPVTPLSSPARRFDAAMEYDPDRDVMVLFGGSNGALLNDTWEYTAGGAASYTTFGVGCAGPQGIPTLMPSFGGGVPIAGQSFSVQVNNLPLDATTWMLLGPSTTQYGTLTLPYDLGNIGIPGCTLWVSGEFVFPMTSVLGVGLWTLDIPAFAAGWTFHNQAVIFYGTSNVLVSDGGTMVIGG